jgi:N-acetylneuraminic acid mutarotase
MAALLPLEIEGCPFPLHGHSACLKPGSNHIYVYGGQTQVNEEGTIFTGAINVLSADEQLTWKKVARTSGATPLPTSYHSSTFISNKMYVFGGLGERNQALSNEIYVLNQDAFLWWYKPRIDTAKPKARYGHTMVAINTTLHLFGGRDDTDVFNDYFMLNTDDLEWHEISVADAPSPRYHHSAVVHDHRVYIFGGTNGSQYFNDLFVFDTEKKEWRQIKTNAAPAPRSEHAAIMIEGKDGPKMLIHGGLAAEGFLNEFFLFDLTREVWQRWYPSGTTSLPRAACSLVQTRDRVMILGGYNSNWVTPPSTTHVFSAKQVCKHARDCTAEDVAPVFFVLESIEQETKIELSLSTDQSMTQSKSPLTSPRTNTPSMNSSMVSVEDPTHKDVSMSLSTSGLIPKPTTPRSGSTSPRVVHLNSSGAVAPPGTLLPGPGLVQSISLPLGLNISNQSELNIPEITAVHSARGPGNSPAVSWRELYEQEKDERMKYQTKLALVENKVESLQSGPHQSPEALMKQLHEREMELEFLRKKIALLRGDESSSGGDSTESKSLMMDLTFLWKRHEQYVKQRDELNKLISASEKMIQRKIEEIGSLFTRGSSAEEHNLVIPNYPSESSSATSSTATTPTSSLMNSTASLSGSSSMSLKTSNVSHGATPPVASTPRPDINTPPRDPFGRSGGNSRMRSPSTPLQGSSSSVTTPNTDKKKQKDKKEKKDKDKDKKLKASSTSSSAHSPPGSERGSLRVTSPKFASGLKKRGTSTYFETSSGSDEITQSNSPRRQTIFNIPFVPPQRAQTFTISVPFVDKCLKFLESYIDTEGIFRVGANADQVSEACRKYTSNPAADISGENHTVVAAALKLYLRDLNDPIVPTILFDKIAAALKITDEDTMNAELKSLMDILPPDCYTILARLFEFLHRVDEQKEKNKMDAKNLSIVFGPAILRSDKTTLEEMVAATAVGNSFVQKCVESFGQIFTKTTSSMY